MIPALQLTNILSSQTGDIILQVLMAITLAAATGLRAFLPLFIVSIAAHFFGLPLSDSFKFLGDSRAVFVFGLATLIEILGDKIPAVDNFLDSVQTFLKPILALLASVAVLSKLDPLLALVIAIAISGTVTLPTQLTKGGVRLVSSGTTGGIANPFISIIEDITSLILSLLAILFPLIAIALLSLLLILIFKVKGRKITSEEAK